MKKTLLALLIFVVTSCVNEPQANKALQDPITLNLVKQSFYYASYGDGASTDFLPSWIYNYRGHPNWNKCSEISRFFYCRSCPEDLAAAVHCDTNCDRPISCDALDQRLKNQGYSNLDSSNLISYYLTIINNKLALQHAEDGVNQNLLQLKKEQELKQQIINMSNGK